MRIESIRHWQWIVLSLVIGFAIGYLQQQFAGDLGSRFGSEITDQRTFEQSLTHFENVPKSAHHFHRESICYSEENSKLR